jgi:hypothetical protein
VLGLAAALLLASIVTFNPRAELGALAGAAMSLFNARLVGGLGRWASRGGAEAARRRLGILLGLFQLKLGILAAFIYLTLRYLPVAPFWLLLGLSLLPLGITARALQYRTHGSASAAVTEGERAMHHHG